jgi:hypothetical protein
LLIATRGDLSQVVLDIDEEEERVLAERLKCAIWWNTTSAEEITDAAMVRS